MSNIPWYWVAKAAGRGAMAIGEAVDAKRKARRDEYLASLTPEQREALLEAERREADEQADASRQRIEDDRYRRVAERASTGQRTAPLRPASYEWFSALDATLALLPPAGTGVRYRLHLSASNLGYRFCDRIDFHIGLDGGRWVFDLCHDACFQATMGPGGRPEPHATLQFAPRAWELVACDPSELAQLHFRKEQLGPSGEAFNQKVQGPLEAAWAAHRHLRPADRAAAIGGVPHLMLVSTGAVMWVSERQEHIASPLWNSYRSWPVPMPQILVDALLGNRDAPAGDRLGWRHRGNTQPPGDDAQLPSPSGPMPSVESSSVCGCGAAISAGQRFCAECGNALGVRCANCRQPLGPQGRFCPHCGTARDSNPAVPAAPADGGSTIEAAWAEKYAESRARLSDFEAALRSAKARGLLSFDVADHCLRVIAPLVLEASGPTDPRIGFYATPESIGQPYRAASSDLHAIAARLRALPRVVDIATAAEGCVAGRTAAAMTNGVLHGGTAVIMAVFSLTCADDEPSVVWATRCRENAALAGVSVAPP